MNLNDRVALLEETCDLLLEWKDNRREWERRTKAWQADGFGPGGSNGRGSKGSHSDPTEAAAETNGYGRKVKDAIRADRYAQQSTEEALFNLVRVLHSRYTKYMVEPRLTPADRGLSPCANLFGCPEDGWATERGRCKNCAQYLRSNDVDRRVRKERQAG